MRARVAEGKINGEPVVLAKPQTYMNLSGRAVGRLGRAHNVLPEQILIVYDDLDLPLGRLRLRPQGGSGGHRGMRSIIDSLGTQDFPRLRVGIDRPPGRVDPADYVLQPFDADQRELLPTIAKVSVAAIECWLATDIATAMDRFNGPVLREVTRQENGT
jgi:PTH1 family peptidyl-tRNA hydrolase